MPQALFEITSPRAEFNRLPLIIRQKSSKSSTFLLVLMMLPVMIAVIIPFSLIGAQAANDPSLTAALWDQPISTLQIFVGLSLWAMIFLIPVKKLLSRLGRERIVRIQAGKVYVTDKHLFYRRKWILPLSSYRGLAHNVRTTHSGSRQELLLVHGDRRRSLLLHASDIVSQDLVEKAARLLSLRQIPSRELYFSFRSYRKASQSTAATSLIAPAAA